MKILFLGLLYQKEDEKLILLKSKYGLQGACNTYQWNLITGLDDIIGEPIQIMNSLPVGSYPRYYKQLFVRSKAWSHVKGASDEDIGFLNLPIFKQIIRYFSFRRKVKQWCRENIEDDLVIISYSMYLPYLKVLADMKKKYKKPGICLIVPDLPNAFGIRGMKYSFNRIVKKYLEKLQYKYSKAADTYVLLTKEMINPLEIKDKPYVVAEGICNHRNQQTITQKTDADIILLYTGALYRRFGLDKLVEAFQNIPQANYKLWLCGVGDYQSEIEKAAKEDERITYFGYVSADIIRGMQQQASILINPRPNEEAYTKYSFPSKTMEYMLSGKPVLMFKLDGIPEEYDNYLYYLKENTVECMKDTILAIAGKDADELVVRGKEAYDFVMKNKNGKIQAGKILTILEKAIMLEKAIENPKISEDSNQYLKVNKENPPYNLIYDTAEKKILQINITCGYGSTGRKVEEIHNFLIEEGFRSFIAYSAYNSRLKGSFRIENTAENYLRRALNRYTGRKYSHSTLGTFRLIRKIKRIRPDLIHLHNIQQNSIHFPMLLKFLKQYGAPVVYTLHDCWAFTGGCYHFTKLDCEGYKTGCIESNCKLPKKQKDQSNQTTDQIYEEKKTALSSLNQLEIICVSNWLKSCAEQSFMKDLPIKVIYNGIDTEIYKSVISNKRVELGITEDEYMILGVANQWNNKGLDTFISLAGILKPPYRIVLVGLTQEDCPENILAVPRTDSVQELVKIYSCADVFFNASKEETFGLAAAEAMACGTPVIAYHSTACGEVVNKDTGILLNTSRMDDLLIAIENLRKSGKMKYSAQCIHHIRRKFSKEEMLRNYLKVYTQMMSGSKGL